MRVMRREWTDTSRSDVFRLYPLFDVHLGSVACDEVHFRRVVAEIEADDNALWIGGGDYAEFITSKDWRFDAQTLAPWITIKDLGDLAAAQRDRFAKIVRPIAHKCLMFLEGNHELSIRKHYERDIYRELAGDIKQAGGFGADHQLAPGVRGWMMLKFCRVGSAACKMLRVYAHHGYGGGRLAGGKALNLQRELWYNDADLVLLGHTHAIDVQRAAVRKVRGSREIIETRFGAVCGTFMTNAHNQDTYADKAGYPPQGGGNVVIELRPGAARADDMIKVRV